MGKKQYSIEEALEALIQGQEEGLDHFFTLYYAPLTYFAFRLVNDLSLAEEIAAEAFVRLWNHRSRLGQRGSIKAWLYRTVRNAAVDHIRKERSIQSRKDQLIQIHDAIETSVLQRMIESETIYQIIHSLQILPPKCGRIFRMFFLQGKSHEEIARELQLSPNTVRVQKAKALRLLRTKVS